MCVMSEQILDCLKRKRDICIKNIIPSQNTAFRWTPALRKQISARRFLISRFLYAGFYCIMSCDSHVTSLMKFPYNARSDWLKQRALSENRALVDDSKLASSNFGFGIFHKFDPNKTSFLAQTNALETSYLSAVNIC